MEDSRPHPGVPSCDQCLFAHILILLPVVATRNLGCTYVSSPLLCLPNSCVMTHTCELRKASTTLLLLQCLMNLYLINQPSFFRLYCITLVCVVLVPSLHHPVNYIWDNQKENLNAQCVCFLRMSYLLPFKPLISLAALQRATLRRDGGPVYLQGGWITYLLSTQSILCNREHYLL